MILGSAKDRHDVEKDVGKQIGEHLGEAPILRHTLPVACGRDASQDKPVCTRVSGYGWLMNGWYCFLRKYLAGELLLVCSAPIVP